MINKEKKQLVEMGDLLKQDAQGKYRNTLRNRIAEIRKETEQHMKEDPSKEELSRLEALLRALVVAERILDKVLVEEPHSMSSESRPML